MFVKRDPFVTTCIVALASTVASILRTRAFSEIHPSIIETIVVSMVTFFSFAASQNYAMHGWMGFIVLCLSTSGIKSLGAFIPFSNPVPHGKPFKVRGINKGILALREWDKTIGWIKRLDNFMSWHLVRATLGAFFHRSSSQGLLKFSRHFIIASGAFLVLLAPAEAGPLDFFKHPIRTMERHPIIPKLIFAGVAAGTHARGLEQCRTRGVEFCDGKYGEAWGIFGAITGANLVGIVLSEKIGGFEGNVIGYGGSAAQLGHGIVQWRKESHAETNLFALTRR
jgi:hypothetical protein